MAGLAPVLLADSIGKRFGEKQVLSAATLHATSGRVTALLGRNGSGKSTLLKIAAGLLAPDHGIIRFRGETYPRAYLDRHAQQGLYFLPVDRPGLSDLFTLGQHIRALQQRYGARDTDEQVLRLLEISDCLDQRPPSLSGGERRRAEIALALLRRPTCLLADEPFFGVTPKDISLLTEAFRRLAAQGCAIVLTGHELEFLFEAVDEVTWMVAGTTYPLGSPEEAQQNWRFRREYLGMA